MNFWQSLLIACIPSLLVLLASFLMYRQQKQILKVELRVYDTIREYLSDETYTWRKFTTIKRHIGGWDNDEDELRKILVKAGAERSYGRENGEEVWKLIGKKK